MKFIEVSRADITGGWWLLPTIMLSMWLRTVCVLLLAAVLRAKVQ